MSRRYFNVRRILSIGSHPAFFLVLIVAVVASWWGYRHFITVPRYAEEEIRGQVGDSYGGLNTLFTGLAFAGLCYSIILHKTEASDERQEVYQRQLEAEFFQLLELFTNTVLSLRLLEPVKDASGNSTSATQLEGRQVLGKLWHLYKEKFLKPCDPATVAETYREAYNGMYEQAQPMLAHYFRTLYPLVRFVDSSELPDTRKIFFTKIVRAQMAAPEVTFLFLNCLKPENRKMTCLALKYDLLKHLPEGIPPAPVKEALLAELTRIAASAERELARTA